MNSLSPGAVRTPRALTAGRTALALAVLSAAVAPRAAAAQAAPGAVSSAAHQEVIERARTLARAALSDDTLPGLSVAVGVNGQLVWAEGFGWADLQQRRPVTPVTRFRVGSVAKPLTAAAAAVLHQRGRLDLDAPVQRYVPSFPGKPWPIATRQLLGHTAGIRDYQNETEMLDDRHCDDVRDGLDVFAGDSLLARPGTRFSYSNFGFALAATAVQVAAREPYAAFMHREIFTPLGMSHTLPELADRPVADQATFYMRAQTLAPAPRDDNSCVLGAGGFLSTPSDLVRFGLGMLRGELLSPETVKLLWTPLRLDSGQSTGYGLGWFVRAVRLRPDAPAAPMIGHGGSSSGAKTSFMVFPEQQLVVAVTANVSSADAASVAGRVAQAFLSGARP